MDKLFCTQHLFKIQMERRATIKVLNNILRVQFELIKHIHLRVFYRVEITVVAITRYIKTCFLIPFSIFNTEIFCLTVTL